MAIPRKKSRQMCEEVEEYVSQGMTPTGAARIVAKGHNVHWQTALKHYQDWDREGGANPGAVMSDLADAIEKLTRQVSALHQIGVAGIRPTPYTEPEVTFTREVTTEVFLSDVHLHPEHKQGHDPAAWCLAKKIIADLQPDIVFWGGDIVDMLSASGDLKLPRLATPEAYEAELAFARDEIAGFVQTLPTTTQHIWLTGNHELRVPRSVHTSAPWLLGRISHVEEELGLESLNIKVVEDGYKIGKLAHFHGHDLAGAGRINIAKNKFDRLNMNMIFGHHHKFSKWLPRDYDKSYRGAWGNACLHWLSADYARFPEWHQGFSIVEYAKSGMFDVHQVLFHKPSVWSPIAETICHGKHYKVDMKYAGNKPRV